MHWSGKSRHIKKCALLFFCYNLIKEMIILEDQKEFLLQEEIRVRKKN